MKKLICKALAVTMLVVPMSVYGSEQKEVSIVISASNSSSRIGQPIPIQIELMNTSGHDVNVATVVGRAQAELNYYVIMLDSNGDPVERTSYGKAAMNRQVIIVSRKLVSLRPGQTLMKDTELTKLFKITRPGTYTARVGRKWPDRTGKMRWSNTLTLTITK